MSSTMRFDPAHAGRLAGIRRMFFSKRVHVVDVRPAPALPARDTQECYRFRDLGASEWCTAGDDGLHTGTTAACAPNAIPLDFDSAVSLSYRYLDEADLAAERGDTAGEFQWSRWAEILQLWAAKGRQPTPVIVRYSAVHADDQAVTFSEMTRRN